MFKCFAFYTNSSHKRYKETNSPTVFKRPFRQKSAEKGHSPKVVFEHSLYLALIADECTFTYRMLFLGWKYHTVENTHHNHH